MDNFTATTGYGFKGFSSLKTKTDKGHREQFALLKNSIANGGQSLIPFDEIINTSRASFAAIESLKNNYNAIAGDWETGAIAYTVSKNKKKLLILRGVSDLVSNTKGEAYGKEHIFINGTDVVMKNLLITLPLWLEKCNN